jgi:phosphohistidine phosphatase
MLRLILFRHAKSSWAYPELTDFERPLNRRGKQDAPAMADRLKPFMSGPFTVLSSPANRAATTARLVMEQWKKPDTAILYRAELYHASPEVLWQVVQKQSSAQSTLLVFGHNEGLTELAVSCSQGSLKHLPTAGVAVFDFDVTHWPEAQQHMARFIHCDYPKKA